MSTLNEIHRRAFAAQEQRGRPVLDALIAGPDPAAVPAGAEILLHGEIIGECRRRGLPYIYHDPTRRTHATLGCPDFIVFAPAGRVLPVECKTATGALSAWQALFQRAVEAQGHAYHVVRSVTAFIRLLEERA